MDPLLKARFDGLLTSNEPPSDEVIAEVKPILEGPRKRLSLICAHISKLKSELDGLELKREEVEGFLEPFNKILSPVRHLPPDVLGEIFRHCLPEKRYPTTSFRDAPLLLTRICRAWRDITISLPRLWSSIYISWTNGGMDEQMSENSTGTSSEYEIMKRRCDIVEMWLSRSRSLPLSLHLRYVHEREPAVKVDTDVNSRMLSILVSSMNRWADVTMVMPVQIYNKFDKATALNMPPMLRMLNVNSSLFTALSMDQQPLTCLLRAPNLRKLSITSRIFDTTTLILLSSNLTDLTCRLYPFGFQDAISLLSTLPAMMNCKMIVSAHTSFDEFHQSTVSLPYLQCLDLRYTQSTDHDQLTAARFYSCLHTPNLKFFSEGDADPYWPYDDFSDIETSTGLNISNFPPMELLRNCGSNLRRLSFRHYGLASSVIQEIFQRLTSLSHLEMGQEHMYQCHMDYIRNAELDRIASILELFDISDLITNNLQGLQQHTEDQSTTQPVYLPNLTVFKARGVRKWADDAVLRFVLSRLDRSNSELGIATLKSVHVSFSRVMDQDIAPMILQYAKEHRIDIDLKLDYFPPPDHHSKHLLSAYYGVRSDDTASTSPFYMEDGDDL